jgi:glycine/D-amino acid oxidase-like deaminating enzyme
VGPAAADSAARGLADAWTAAYPDTGAELVTGSALHDLDPALADDLVACRLDIGYPAAPASATRAYAALAERLGASIVIGGDARLAVRDGVAVGVEVDRRLVEAGSVVVAAGPWTPDVLTAAGATSPPWPPIRRSWGVVAAIELERPPRHVLEEIDIDIEPTDGGDGSAAGDSGYGFSLVTADGASALGSTFLPEPPDESAAVGPLRERGARYVPAIGAARVVAMRTCARPVSPDGRPLLGPIPGVRGAFLAAGHGPWGISTGPGSARLVADLVLGRVDEVPAALDPIRFGAPAALVQRAPLPG